ncbi:uncharacterized protein EDB91DRAFT_1120498 [Suillus paluster]|uniref:uncharacterized protein n=1 Tax=Suillus paluster TaxID=48578 RepID=UPI001B8740EC|nr:uncharacterized protein EDB91DRAFT_1120498 [Suillus paluster]KAG1745360.1 hypothetical protein EDB91DRAFT_1120498 [Suillus paluster]
MYYLHCLLCTQLNGAAVLLALPELERSYVSTLGRSANIQFCVELDLCREGTSPEPDNFPTQRVDTCRVICHFIIKRPGNSVLINKARDHFPLLVYVSESFLICKNQSCGMRQLHINIKAGHKTVTYRLGVGPSSGAHPESLVSYSAPSSVLESPTCMVLPLLLPWVRLASLRCR